MNQLYMSLCLLLSCLHDTDECWISTPHTAYTSTQLHFIAMEPNSTSLIIPVDLLVLLLGIIYKQTKKTTYF